MPSCEQNEFLGYDPVTGDELWKDEAVCNRYARSCANGGSRWDIYLRQPGESAYHLSGSVCLLPSQQPMSGAEVAAGVAARFHDAVPEARFKVQPTGVQVVNVPTIFYVEEHPVAFPPHTVGGITVRIEPSVEYYWRYDVDAPFVGPTGAGAAYPHQTITHPYAAPGRRTATLRAVWTASFTAFGATFDVPGQVVREATAALDVREARARLQYDN